MLLGTVEETDSGTDVDVPDGFMRMVDDWDGKRVDNSSDELPCGAKTFSMLTLGGTSVSA